jgi:putative hydrolase of the HAD superfamily
LSLRAVVFDLDDTLADSSGIELVVWESVVEIIDRYVGPVDRALLRDRYLAALERHYPRLLADQLDFVAYRRERLADAVSPWGAVDDELFAAYAVEKERMVDEIAPFSDAVSTLRLLRARGIRIGVLTNGPSDLQRRKLELCRLEAEVDAVAVSGEIGCAKPEPAAFETVLRLLGARPEEAAMVGDSLENDVHGALRAGFAAVVWMCPNGDVPPPGARAVRCLRDVPPLLALG